MGVIKAYLDGSGHGDKTSTLMTLSGFVGTTAGWSDFEARWGAAVASMLPANSRHIMGLQAADMTAWAFNRNYTKQDDWVAATASIVKAQFHKFYGETELRALP